MTYKIKILLFLIFMGCLSFGISAYLVGNTTVMKFGIIRDVDYVFDSCYLFELKKDRVLQVSKGDFLYTDFYDSEKDGNIGFDTMEWPQESGILEEASVKLSRKQYKQLVDLCNDIKTHGPKRNAALGATEISLLYDGNVYASTYYSFPWYDFFPLEYEEENQIHSKLKATCELLRELSPIAVNEDILNDY